MSRFVRNNPYFILELPVNSSELEVERAGHRLLAMLGVQMEDAATYESPLGQHSRDEDLIRQAMRQLSTPDGRILARLWATSPGEAPSSKKSLPPWQETFKLLGWRR